MRESAALNLDPSQFVIIPHVAMVDEFKMTDDEGGLVAFVDVRFLAKLVQRMRERETTTGDLCPLVIGHTRGLKENDEAQVVGLLRNWVLDDFFTTGKKASFCDVWFYPTSRVVVDGVEMVLTAKEINEKWPRRSAEIWADRHEADPVSLLGATTPARDLGLIKLNRNGSVTYFCPGEMTVPDNMTPATAAGTANEMPAMQEMVGLLKQLVQGQQQMMQAMSGGVPPTTGPGGAMPQGGEQPGQGMPGQGDQGGDLSDEEIEQLLSGMGDQSGQGGEPGATAGGPPPPEDDQSRKGEEPPVKNNGAGCGYGGNMNTHVTQLQRPQKTPDLASELAATRNELHGLKIKLSLQAMREQDLDVNPDDEALIADLAAMPPDMRNRQIDRIKKNARLLPSKDNFHLNAAITHADNGQKGKRVPDQNTNYKIIQLARSKNVSYEQAAGELGYSCE